jgi:hypothetical protein
MIAILAASLAGCAQYVQVETDLIDQARRGVAITARSLESRSQLIAHQHEIRRSQLDDAFDADVRERAGALTADWVIEARRAYAVGVDALHVQQRATDQTTLNDQRTLHAVDEALRRLRWLRSIEARWAQIPEEVSK